MLSVEMKQEGLGHALDDKRLAVPIYQRSYTWKTDHVKELFEDYTRAVRDWTDYFLGTVVTAKSVTVKMPDKNGNHRPEIVDGQQRLATTTILLAAIRDYFYSTGDKEGAGIVETTYLMSIDLDTRTKIPHLNLNEHDGQFFINYVLEAPDYPARKAARAERDSHRRIIAAANLAKKKIADILKGQPKSDYTEILNRWVKFLKEKAQVIWLTVSDYADAYVIFETLNDRGLELSLADLLKNYLFWKSGDRIQEAQRMWSEMTGILEAVSDEDITTYYIHHLWSSRFGLTRKRDLFREVRKKITNQQTVVDLLRDLIANAKLYAALRNPDHGYWNEFGGQTRQCLRDLEAIRVWQIRILLLAVLGEFSVSEAKKIFPLAVSWSVRFMIAGGSPGNLESIYTKYAVRIREKEIASAKDLTKAMTKEAPDNATFEAQFSTARVSFEYIARYLLRRLNDTVAPEGPRTGAKVDVDETIVNLEHIYPKNPDGKVWADITQEEAEHIENRLGNMALMLSADNAKVGNVSFKKKKLVYKKQPFPLTKKLHDYDDT